MDINIPDLKRLIDKLQDGSITAAEKQLLLKWYDQLNIAAPESWDFDGQKALVRRELHAGIEFRLRRTRVALLYRITGWSTAAVFLVLLSVWMFRRNSTKGDKGRDFENALAWMIISNDKATAKRVTLPDGSTVWLNSNARLRLNEGFGKDNRLVQADGEILLDIRPNKNLPFRVVTRNITTTVLGTLFNIEAYPDETELKISLMNGKVLVTDSTAGAQTLEPGQSAISSGPGRLSLASRDNSNAGNWIRGELVFNETLLSDALRRIERKYEVTFQYDPALLTDLRVTSIITEGGDWEATLKPMLFIHNIQFKKSNRVIRLYR